MSSNICWRKNSEFPLATATSCSANALSGKKSKVHTECILQRYVRPLNLSMGVVFTKKCCHPELVSGSVPQQNAGFRNKPLPPLAPLCRVSATTSSGERPRMSSNICWRKNSERLYLHAKPWRKLETVAYDCHLRAWPGGLFFPCQRKKNGDSRVIFFFGDFLD